MHAQVAARKTRLPSLSEREGEEGRKDAAERKHMSAGVGVGNFEYEFKFNTCSLLKAGKSSWTTSYVYLFLVSKQLQLVII